jgi:NAD(P)-dependent dehydrogenase (short-subunit alcohol dehydrogenase family)
VSKPLLNRVALVAGATRGAGRGIALELALAGAIVYATGRSSRTLRVQGTSTAGAALAHDDPRAVFELANRPETIEDTAELITAHGGTAYAVRTDHSQIPEVEALIARIEREQGRLDILVNDIWGGDALCEWGTPVWQLDLQRGFTLFERAVHTHLITSRCALPLMLRGARGLIVEVTDGDGHYYRGNAFYDLAKSAVVRMAFMLAEELRETPVAAVAITPGFLRSEAMLEYFGVTESNWRDAIAKDAHFAHSETPRYVGRAIAALAADPDLPQLSGRGFSSWQLQTKYGFTDVDSRTPHWGDHASQCDFGKAQAKSDERFQSMFRKTPSD